MGHDACFVPSSRRVVPSWHDASIHRIVRTRDGDLVTNDRCVIFYVSFEIRTDAREALGINGRSLRRMRWELNCCVETVVARVVDTKTLHGTQMGSAEAGSDAHLSPDSGDAKRIRQLVYPINQDHRPACHTDITAVSHYWNDVLDEALTKPFVVFQLN